MLLNGKHRLTAVESIDGAQCGFVVFENVPRWMFKYFDTGKTRTIKDVFHVGGRSAMPQTPSALRLALRYEEFLYGKRPGHGWRQWKQVPDEHEDLDEFLSRRLEMQDWYSLAEKMQRQAKLMTPAALVWRFYQSLAWPEGDEEITAFTDSLMTGSMLAPKSPVLLLRNWAKMCHEESLFVPAKRETHLFLLFKAFAQRESRLDALQWAYGMPMSLPYHPKGWEAAKENIMKALAELDATA